MNKKIELKDSLKDNKKFNSGKKGGINLQDINKIIKKMEVKKWA